MDIDARPVTVLLDERWAAVRRGDQRIIHLVPLQDGIRHDVWADKVTRTLLPGGPGECVCGPLTRETGWRVVMHHALDGRSWPSPSSVPPQ